MRKFEKYMFLPAGAVAVCVSACDGRAQPALPIGYNEFGPTGGVSTGGVDPGSGGAPSSVSSGGSTGGVFFIPPGGASFAEGGGAGSSNTDFAWLEAQGDRCGPSTAVPTPLPYSPGQLCALMEIGLPGVIEYVVDPSAFDLDRTGQGGLYTYEGCDGLGTPCIGRMEYDWEVEYLADNEWYVSITPVRTECDYDHVLLHELPTGELSARGTLSWAPIELTLHLQPFDNGLTVGAVRSLTDEIVETGAFTEMEFNGGWPEDELRGLFDEAFIEHLKSLVWTCLPT